MELLEYPVRICIAGSRSFHNSYTFDAYLREYLAWVGDAQPIAFISGGAKRGPDALIIEWARKHDYPCFVMEANWDEHGRGAGFRRNAKMREVMIHLFAFWDGESSGTEEMVDKSMENISNYANVSMVIVKPDSSWVESKKHRNDAKHRKSKNAWKQKSR